MVVWTKDVEGVRGKLAFITLIDIFHACCAFLAAAGKVQKQGETNNDIFHAGWPLVGYVFPISANCSPQNKEAKKILYTPTVPTYIVLCIHCMTEGPMSRIVFGSSGAALSGLADAALLLSCHGT